MSKEEIRDLTFEALKRLEGNWSTDPADLRADIKEFASEYDANCEFWFENSGAILFHADDDSYDAELPFEIRKSGACTYILEFML